MSIKEKIKEMTEEIAEDVEKTLSNIRNEKFYLLSDLIYQICRLKKDEIQAVVADLDYTEIVYSYVELADEITTCLEEHFKKVL